MELRFKDAMQLADDQTNELYCPGCGFVFFFSMKHGSCVQCRCGRILVKFDIQVSKMVCVPSSFDFDKDGNEMKESLEHPRNQANGL